MQFPRGKSAVMLVWLALAGFILLPWYIPGARHMGGPIPGFLGSAAELGFNGAKPWLLVLALPILAAIRAVFISDRVAQARLLAWAGGIGLALLILQAFLFGMNGPAAGWLGAIFGADASQDGLGLGALVVALAFLLFLCTGMAGLGYCKGDAFVASAIGLVIGSIAIFVFFPAAFVFSSAFVTSEGFGLGQFFARITDQSIWGLNCLSGGRERCGVAWNTVALASFVGIACTLMGLCFALIAVRTDFPFKAGLRALSILPIITPPFVIGLALILIFGRSGVVSTLAFQWFGIPPSRWIYGATGVAIAQVLAFTPICFMILLGVLQGIAPSLEEASQTLRASRWTTFRTVTFPLLRPGLANSFLIGFIESMADFGNPLVLGGNFEVLSTKIFYAVVGSAADESRAAVLAIVLLAFTMGAFWLQQVWLGKKVYTTVAGKGDAGMPSPLPRRIKWLCAAVALPWTVFTAAIYVLILIGGFVVSLGRDYTPTLVHVRTAFNIDFSGTRMFVGSAWDSLFTTLKIALMAAPLTAILGLTTAYLLSRQDFAGKRAFEAGTMLSFALPGTVIGVSYIMAFNTPPIELTGTAMILVICFVFRNMPVGVRSGIATLSQLDKSLDEASLTLGAGTATTLRKIILPLLKPAIVTTMVFSFVRAMTSVSAVIFLVSAKYNLATTYVVGRVEAGEFGIAIAYSAILIILMLIIILLIQMTVGERRLGRRTGRAVPR